VVVKACLRLSFLFLAIGSYRLYTADFPGSGFAYYNQYGIAAPAWTMTNWRRNASLQNSGILSSFDQAGTYFINCFLIFLFERISQSILKKK